jgi:adenosylcobalamin-dependent ribonucleoside-triphosphate reductase
MNKEDYIFAIKEKFKLSDNFIEKYKGSQPDWGPIGYVTFKRTYARTIKDENRTEEFWETLQRVVEGCYTVQMNHCKHLRLTWNAHQAQRSAQEMYKLMWGFKFLPPGRSLWIMGSDVVWKKGAGALLNCAFVSTQDIDEHFSDPFVWGMDLSMLGVGVGFNTSGVGKVKFVEPKYTTAVHVVADSKEGWAEIVRVILEAFVGKEKIPENIDYSEIRPKGSPIKTFGGIAPGPDPLIECVNDLKSFLIERIGKVITAPDIVDIMNMIGKCVVSGGVRRTALMAMGSHTDSDYMEMKDPTKYADLLKKWRWASNNSVCATIGMDYDKLANQCATNGEPGFVWMENIRAFGRIKDGANYIDVDACGVNPCGEQSLESYEACNLVETFPSLHDSAEEYQKTLKYAYLYAKTVTLIPTHSERTNQVLLRNRRIGLSMSGIVDAMYKFGRRSFLFDFCDRGYEYIKKLDDTYSRWLCVPKSIKMTTTKPSGTVSLLPGVSPGIHWPHAEHYIRRVEVQKTSPIIDELIRCGIRYEQSVYKKECFVFEFPIQTENFKKSKKDVSIWEQMELNAAIQYYWSDNNVSQTVTFDPATESHQIKDVLEAYEDRIKAVSFLPLGDTSYEQMPYQEITKEEYWDRQAEITSTPDFSSCGVVDENNEDKESLKFCTTEHCLISFPQEARELSSVES